MADGRTSDERRDELDDTVPAGDPASHEPAAPPRSERYRLGVELGRGGMGRVVEAFDIQLGRTVALKEVLPQGSAVVARRFRREVQITARLEHASIVPLYDSGVTADGRPFYVMRRVSGRPLDELVTRARGLGERLTLLPAVLAAIDAVAHAHRRGVIHRDLKPANILVGELGETVVIDWGLAKVIGEDDDDHHDGSDAIVPSAADSLQTQVGAVFGTPGFMAPEQARGEELGPRGDVYALGATLYQLLAGAPPHAGSSATEVLDRTRKHEFAPLDQVSPGAPPELVAIVGKSLAFEAAERYADAGALGEDVRRFLAGQLVAAHRYTRRQRVARFVRMQRAPLAVAALALAAGGVLAGVGVHRIVSERDEADEARRAADDGKRIAEDARDELTRRVDEQIVLRARALAESNPTEAAAVLKRLPPTSRSLPAARAVANEVAVRGIGWAMHGGDTFTVTVELSSDSTQLLQLSMQGVLSVWDLERRRLEVARTFPITMRPLWVAGGKILLVDSADRAQLYDPKANTVEALALGSVKRALATAAGDHVLLVLADQTAGILEVATGAVTPLWPGHAVADIAYALDGSWAALSDHEVVAVFDGAGNELTRHAGKVWMIAGSRARRLALLGNGTVYECRLDPKPTWTEVKFTLPQSARLLEIAYRGGELDAYASNTELLGWNGKYVYVRGRIDQVTFRLAEAGDDLLLVPSADGKLHFVNSLVTGAIPLPSVLSNLRIASRAGSTRVAAIGPGLIVVFDLSEVLPRSIPIAGNHHVVFVDDNTLLIWSQSSEDWRWYDIPTRVSTPFTYEQRGPVFVAGYDAMSGRVLFLETTGTGTRLVLLDKTRPRRDIVSGPSAWGVLLAADTLVFGAGDGRIFAQVGDATPHELGTVDGKLESAGWLGQQRFAAVSTVGEVVRGDVATGTLERVRIQPGAHGFVGGDGDGHPVIVEDNRISVWTNDVVELPPFASAISEIGPVQGGLIVMLADHEAQFVELSPRGERHRVLPPSGNGGIFGAEGRLLAGTGNGGQVTIVEFPERVAWKLPILYSATDILAIAPNGRWLLQGSDDVLGLWTLPTASSDLGAWLDERTNASDRDDVLAWPWQVP